MAYLRQAGVLGFTAFAPSRRCRSLGAGFSELMTLRRLEDLARLYSLAARIHALDPVKAAFRAYIKSTGLALIMDEEKVGPAVLLPSSCWTARFCCLKELAPHGCRVTTLHHKGQQGIGSCTSPNARYWQASRSQSHEIGRQSPTLQKLQRRQTAQDKEMVTALLDMKAGLDAVLNQSFQSAEPFAHALKDAFEHFINQRANRPVRPVHPRLGLP